MNHRHMSFQMHFLNEQTAANVAFKLSGFVPAFVFIVPVDISLVFVDASALIKTFESLFHFMHIRSEPFTKNDTKLMSTSFEKSAIF